MPDGWPAVVRIANTDFDYVERNGDVYYEPQGGNRNSYAYVSIHNPGDHFLRWDGEYWTKAHNTRNKFISLKFFRGSVSYPRDWSNSDVYRLDTDPDNQGEWQATYNRAKSLGVLFWTRIQIKQAEAMKEYVKKFSQDDEKRDDEGKGGGGGVMGGGSGMEVEF